MRSLYLYLDHRTWVHRLHPVVRVWGMAAFFITAFLVERPAAQVPVLALLVALVVWTGSLPNIRRLRVLLSLIFIMTFLIWTFFYGPDGQAPLLTVAGLVVSRTAPWFALGMAIKLRVIVAAGILFLSVGG